MTIILPQPTDTENNPSHSFLHRIITVDTGSSESAVHVDGSDNMGIGTTTPNSKLNIIGSLSLAYVAKTANYTLNIDDYFIECTANTFTITLPTAVSIEGRVYLIKNTGTGIVTVDGNGSETLDGELIQTLNQWDSITIISNGANWLIT